MTERGRLRAPALTALAFWLACSTPLAQGEARYRQGDWLGALEIWRSVPADSRDREAARRRIEEVESEYERLVVRYKQRGRYFERSGRLAESILNYRLALKLQTDDRQTLGHVQTLARTLAEQDSQLKQALRDDLKGHRLGAARRHLMRLRKLDPFDPTLESQEREVEEQIRVEVERVLREGSHRFRRGELDAAESRFRQVLELDPRNESAQGYLSYLATVRSESERTGLRPVRLHTLERFATEAEIRAEGFHQNALAAERAGDPWRAIRYELGALRVYPEHAEATRHLAALRDERASDVEALIESGRSYFRQEDLQSALDQWRRVLLIDPENSRARDYVARAERMLENLERLRSEPSGHVGAR